MQNGRFCSGRSRAAVARSDLLLGPYFTVLRRAADDMAAEAGWLVWNHGGSGDDVETAHPGHVVSVLTPTSRYLYRPTMQVVQPWLIRRELPWFWACLICSLPPDSCRVLRAGGRVKDRAGARPA